MGRYKIINHTADTGIEVEGKDLTEVFFESYKGLYKIAGVEKGEKEGGDKIKIVADTYEELLIKFLNELIFYIYGEKKYCEIKKLEIKKEDKEIELKVEIEKYGIKKFEREVKAATYHNISIKNKNGAFATKIIFDL